MVEPRDVRAGLLDERGPAAHRAEGVDDAVVLGEVPGMLAVHGHPAHRVEQDDVVDDRRERRASSAAAAAVAGQRRRARRRPRTRRGRAGPGRARRGSRSRSPRASRRRGRCPPAPAAPPAAPRARWPRRAATSGRRRARVGDATSPTYDDVAPQRRGERLLVPDALRRDDDVRRQLGVDARRARSPSTPARRPGRRRASAIGSNTDTRQPVAAPRVASAPTIGVVPASHSDGAGRCGST